MKHLCLEIIKQQQIPPLHRELVKAATSSKRNESLEQRSISLAKYDGARLSLRHFKSEKIFSSPPPPSPMGRPDTQATEVTEGVTSTPEIFGNKHSFVLTFFATNTIYVNCKRCKP